MPMAMKEPREIEGALEERVRIKRERGGPGGGDFSHMSNLSMGKKPLNLLMAISPIKRKSI